MYCSKNIRLDKLRTHFGCTEFQKRRGRKGRTHLWPSLPILKGKNTDLSILTVLQIRKSSIVFKSSVWTTNPGDRTPWILSLEAWKSQSFVWIPAMTKSSGIFYNFLWILVLCSGSQGGKCARRRWSPSFFGGAGVQCRGTKEKGQLPPLFFDHWD